MYTGLLHTHRLVVILFLLHYLVKLVLLLLNRNETLANYSKRTRITEIVISVLFLVTGVWMLSLNVMSGGAVSALQIIKICAVLASIPLAIIGFKKGNKILAVLSVILIVAAYGLAEVNKKNKAGAEVNTANATNAIEAGKIIYQEKCIQCHGSDGAAGISGAKALGQTVLNREDQKTLLKVGKNSMPSFEGVLSDKQIDEVLEFVETFNE